MNIAFTFSNLEMKNMYVVTNILEQCVKIVLNMTNYRITAQIGMAGGTLAGRAQQLRLVSYQLQPKLLRSIFLCNQFTSPTDAIGALLHMVAAKSCKVSRGPFTNYVKIGAKIIIKNLWVNLVKIPEKTRKSFLKTVVKKGPLIS